MSAASSPWRSALRQGLDAADIRRFPEAKFGKAIRSNLQRYSKIAESYSHRGAMQGDPQKAVGGVMLNRQSEDYNDVGWDILPGNYSRFLSQIRPDETSIGWWHKGPKKSVYGRFARESTVHAFLWPLMPPSNAGFVGANLR